MNKTPVTEQSAILSTIGNTPLVKLQKIVPETSADVYVKLEYFNPTGSYKDRMALAMVEEAEKRGELTTGMTVVEYTGGSTGSSLAFVCAVKGYKFVVVTSDCFALEKTKTMQAFGAEVIIERSVGGKITPDLIGRMIKRAEQIQIEHKAYFTNQLRNKDVHRGYVKIGRELVGQLDTALDVYCGAVGTAGMLMGVSHALRDAGWNTQIVALEPATSAVLSGGEAGSHHVEGIAIGYAPPLLDKKYYDDALPIKESDAREMARRLAKEEGVFTGTSSGMNVVGVLQIAAELGSGKSVATVAVDTGLKYLAGDLYEF